MSQRVPDLHQAIRQPMRRRRIGSIVRARRRISTGARVLLAAGLATGAALAATSGLAAASGSTATQWGSLAPQAPWGGMAGAGWPSGVASGPAPDSAWGGPAGWAAFAPGAWGNGPSAPTESFHVVSTNPRGPGAIIITGVVNAGGIEHPGQGIDTASFGESTFHIDHSSGHPTVRFDPTTCVGTISQTGPFRVDDASGGFASINGSGTYRFSASYTTAPTSHGCSKTMTAYLETIQGAITLSR